MKKLIIGIVLLACAGSANAQFPNVDSLRKFNNRYIRNSAIDAFTNLRLNAVLNGIINATDSALTISPALKIDSVTIYRDSIQLNWRGGSIVRRDTLRGAAGAATLDSLRTAAYFRIKSGASFAQINVTDSVSNLAGAYPQTDRKKLQRNEFSLSYAEMRNITNPSKGAYYNVKINDTYGQFSWNATSTSPDDSVMTIKLAGITTGRLVRSVSDYVDLRWFEGVTEGADITVPFQKAINLILNNPSTMPSKLMLIGHYTVSAPLELWIYNTTAHRYEQSTISIIGDPASTKIGGNPRSQITYTFKQAPLFNVQLGKSTHISGIFVVGPWTNPSLTATQFYNTPLASYTDPTCLDQQYGLLSCLSIDGLSYDRVPPDSGIVYFARKGYYTRATGQPFVNSGSTGIEMDHMFISNFGAAITNSINEATQNNELAKFSDIFVTSCKLVATLGQSEEKNNNYEHIAAWSSVHTDFDNLVYGRHGQAGNYNFSDIQNAGQTYQMFNINVGGTFPSNITNVFAESVAKFGTVTSGGEAVTVKNATVSFALPTDRGGYYSDFHINASPQVRFTDCSWKLNNTLGWPIIFLGAPIIDHNSFEGTPYFSDLNSFSSNSYPQITNSSFSGPLAGSPGLGLTGFKWGFPTSWANSFAYGNYSLANSTVYVFGYYKQYDVKGDIYSYSKTIEAAKSITVDATLRTWNFSTTKKGYFQIGDPVTIFNGSTWKFGGLVTDTTGNISVAYAPSVISSGTYDIISAKPIKVNNFLGNVTSGSKIITKVINSDFPPAVGSIIYNPYFGGYTAVEKIRNDSIWTADAATGTKTNILFQPDQVKKIYNVRGTTQPVFAIPAAELFKEGDQVVDYSTAGKKIIYDFKTSGYWSTDSSRRALYEIRDSTTVFDPADGDSSKISRFSTGWVKRNAGSGGSGGSVPDATTSIKGKIQVGNWLTVNSGVLHADSTKQLPRFLYSDVTINQLGANLEFRTNSLPTAFDNIIINKASGQSGIISAPSNDQSYHAGIWGPSAGSFTIGINHPYHFGSHNGSTPGIAVLYNGAGFAPERKYTIDASGNIYHASDVLDIGVTNFYTNPRFSAVTASSDTTTYKPMGLDGSGNPVRMNRWPGAGATDTSSGSNLVAYLNNHPYVLKVDSNFISRNDTLFLKYPGGRSALYLKSNNFNGTGADSSAPLGVIAKWDSVATNGIARNSKVAVGQSTIGDSTFHVNGSSKFTGNVSIDGFIDNPKIRVGTPTANSMFYWLTTGALGITAPMTTNKILGFSGGVPAPVDPYITSLTTTGTTGTAASIVGGVLNIPTPSSLILYQQAGNANNATGTTSFTFNAPNDGIDHVYHLGARASIAAISSGSLTVTYSWTDETNNTRTKTFYEMGSSTAALTTTGATAFPVVDLSIRRNTTLTITFTFTGTSITFTPAHDLIKII